jgi:hypothetical protein
VSGRLAGLERRELWGYVVWGAGTLVVVIPEISAATNHVPWPTISATVGHLETRWNWVALIVVGIIVSVAFHASRFPVSEPGTIVEQMGDRKLGRTEQGRFTRVPEGRAADQGGQMSLSWLFMGAAIVALASGLTAIVIRPGNKFMLAYVLYGLTAVIFIGVPSVLAFWFAKDVPFPTFFRTITFLEKRLHFAAVLIIVGLVILLIHLALYPWPDIFDHLRPPAPAAP